MLERLAGHGSEGHEKRRCSQRRGDYCGLGTAGLESDKLLVCRWHANGHASVRGGRVRLVIAAAITVTLALWGCSGSRPRTEAGSGQPVVTRTTSLTPRPTITPRSTPAHTSAPSPKRLVIRDRADDVLQTIGLSDNDPKQVSYPRGDLRRVTITHGPLTIDVVAQFGDLQPTSLQLFEVQLRTLDRTYYGDGVLRRNDRTALSLQWEFQYQGNTFTLRCPAASGRADFARKLVFIAVPATCLDSPLWVRLNVWNTMDSPDGVKYEDRLDRVEASSYEYTPRVY